MRLTYVTAGRALAAAFALGAFAGIGAAQTAANAAPAQAVATAHEPPVSRVSTAAAAVIPPSDYVIGPDDILTILFWRDKELSGDATVRPDGKITLLLLNDVQAAGLTPDQLRARITQAAGKFLAEPNATVIVKQINSRKVFITGQVEKPGSYPLTAPITVVQLIAMAGGLKEFAEGGKIVVMRSEGSRQTAYPFNYEHVAKRRDLRQNIELKSGDTVIVP